MTTFESRSVAWWIYALAGLLGAAGIVFMAVPSLVEEAGFAIGVALLTVGLIVANFAVLTIRVTREVVTWRFGLGPFGWTIPVERIRGVSTRREPWFYGWGIRWTPRGWLWRSSGLDAVWIALDSGRSIGVGSQDSERLGQAIRDRIPAA